MTQPVQVVRREAPMRGRMSPLRRRVLELLAKPHSATTMADELGESRQKINYHLRELEKAGLVELLEERPRRGCTERVLRATAQTVIIEPDVIGEIEAVRQDRFAADTLVALSARALRDVAGLRERAEAEQKRLLTFAIEAEVAFGSPADVERFAHALGEAVAELGARFDTQPDAAGDPEAVGQASAPTRATRRYRIVIGGHPVARPPEAPERS